MHAVGRAKHAVTCGERFVEAEKSLGKLVADEKDLADRITGNAEQKKARAATLRNLWLVGLAALVCVVAAAGIGFGFQFNLYVVVAVIVAFGLATVLSVFALIRCQGILADISNAREGLLEKRNQIAATRGVAEVRLESAQSERAQAFIIVPNPDTALREANLRLQDSRLERERIAVELATLDGQLPESHRVTPEQVKAAEQRVVALRNDVEEKKHVHDAARHEQAKTQARLEEKAASLTGVNVTDFERRVEAARLELGEQTALVAPDLVGAQADAQLAKQAETEREMTMRIVQDRLAYAQSRFRELATALGRPPAEVLAEAEAAKKAAEKALEDLETKQSPAADVAEKEFLEAQTCVKDLENRTEPTKSQFDTTISARDEARERLAQAKMKLDALLQSHPITDATLADAVLAKSRQQLDEDVAMSNDLPPDLGKTEALLEQRKAELQGIENAIHEARGALAHVGGAVLAEQLDREREEYERLKASAEELELEFNGIRCLRDLLKESAAKHTAHLGKNLAEPVAGKFLALTANRYTHVAFDAGLRVENVVVNGGEREVAALSVGTRDQLATLIRLVLAAYLKTAVVLDDQLTQTDPGRLGWFRDLLDAGVRDHGHQIIVITCRPQDYVLQKHEMPAALERWESDDGTLTIMDLQRIISRG
jgi:hypothetical protein